MTLSKMKINYNSAIEDEQVQAERLIYSKIFNEYNRIERCNCIFSILGLCLSIVNFEIAYATKYDIKEGVNEWDVYPDPMHNPRNEHAYTNHLRIIVCFTSLISIICNYKRYNLKVKWLKLLNYKQKLF